MREEIKDLVDTINTLRNKVKNFQQENKDLKCHIEILDQNID